MLQHRLATPVIQPRMYFFDKDGKPLVGGKVYSFKVGTDEFKPTYRNSEFTAANQNPILLDQAGSALIYVRGSVQLKIYDKQGNLIEEKIEYQQRELTQFFDNYGKALSNGKIWTYDYQSTIKKTSYKYEDVRNPNPVVLDQNGWGAVNIVGAYRLRILDKNNMVVGDQDFKRPPARVLTSRVYPLYFEENIATSFSFEGALQNKVKTEFYFTDNASTSFNISQATIRSLRNDIDLNNENIRTSFAVTGAVVREVSFIFKPEIEKALTSFGLLSAQLKETKITHASEDEKLSILFALTGAEIKN